MSNWNLPPGVTDRMVDEAAGHGDDRRGVYTVTIVRTIETVVEIEAASEADAEQDAKIIANATLLKDWLVLDEDVVVQDPPERDPDEARDARIDYAMDRDR